MRACMYVCLYVCIRSFTWPLIVLEYFDKKQADDTNERI